MALSEARGKKLSLGAIFFTFLIDALSWSIVFPIFAPFFLDLNNQLFSPEISIATRTTVLGFFLASFSLGQFIGAPILGEYGDLKGRKRALSLSVFFTLLGFVISAWSIQAQNLYLLFAGRLITGIFAGNMSICLACIADLFEEENKKVKYFGYLSAISGASFIIGAFLGGELSDHSIHPALTPSFPFWIAAVLSLGNFLFVVFGFKETALSKKESKFCFLACFSNLRDALRTEKIKSIYLIFFLFLFSWAILLQFIPVLMVQRFYFTSSNIGDLALFMGVCWIIGAVYMNKILSIYFKPWKILEGCFLGFTMLCTILIFPLHVYNILAVVAGCVILGGLAWPICTGLISSAAPSAAQGKILGVSQSMQSAAMTLAPCIAGISYQVFEGFAFLLAAGVSLFAGIFYFALKKP